MTSAFSYQQAYARNIGWVTHAEQSVWRGKRVAIAGLGGVGGVHLLTLARLGIGNFHVANFDTFEVANINRQVGATVTAAPLGMGTAVLSFLIGLAPAGLHGDHLIDPSRINLKEQRGPSTIIGCELCAGAAATVALKILLHRGAVLAAPHGYQFDAYRNKLTRTYRPGGNRHPLQRIAMLLARRRMAGGVP